MVRFRPLRHADLPLVVSWLNEPHVAAWWRNPDEMSALRATLDGTDPTQYHLILLDEVPIGLVQRYRIADHPDWAATLAPIVDTTLAAGVDYFIGVAALTNRGVGTEMIGAFVADTLARWPDLDSIVIDVSAANRPSWRVLERNGFTRIFEGNLDSNDPSDAGPQYVYWLARA